MEEKIIKVVLSCAQYLVQQKVPSSIIKNMLYLQLKNYSFPNIKKIADDENIDLFFLINENEEANEKKQQQATKQKKKRNRNIERIRASKHG
ncbi:MAG: hypothetical protein LBG48_05955 [Rickettsiales bacterium]|jgi:hypothetical protein|nr:hypothetical protein [Rickettsiales bacterium]